jgi:hypothetical protein
LTGDKDVLRTFELAGKQQQGFLESQFLENVINPRSHDMSRSALHHQRTNWSRLNRAVFRHGGNSVCVATEGGSIGTVDIFPGPQMLGFLIVERWILLFSYQKLIVQLRSGFD